MKKTSVILLVTALILCNVGFYFSYLLGKIKIHAQVEAMMDHLQPNQLIAIPDTAIKQNNWEDKDKEFSYKNEMYDVVKIDTINGQKVYYSLNDTKESKLEDAFADQIEKQQGNGKNTTTIFFLKIACTPIPHFVALDLPNYFSKVVYCPLVITKISNPTIDILHPPPAA